jgi:hypothetical protein
LDSEAVWGLLSPTWAAALSVITGDIERQGLVDFVAALERLKATSFYYRRGLLEALLAQSEPKKH